jgi:hypothetical protein
MLYNSVIPLLLFSRRRQQQFHIKQEEKEEKHILSYSLSCSLSLSLLGTIVACFAANGTTSTAKATKKKGKEMKINNRRRRSRVLFTMCTRREKGGHCLPRIEFFLFLYIRETTTTTIYCI